MDRILLTMWQGRSRSCDWKAKPPGVAEGAPAASTAAASSLGTAGGMIPGRVPVASTSVVAEERLVMEEI